MKLLLLALMLTIMLNVSAQNPYAEFDKDAAKYGVNVEFSGQQPKITDFITAYVNSVAEEEFFSVWIIFGKNISKTNH